MSDPAQAATRAITLAVEAMAGLGIDAAAYELVSLQSAVLTKDADPFRWRLEFKTADSMPKQRGGKVGKGGQLALSVDLERGAVERLRGGD